AAFWTALIASLWAVRQALLMFQPFWPAPSRALPWIALGAILTWGALLRVDAIAGRFDAVTSPGWVRAIEARGFLPASAIRPWRLTCSRMPPYPHADGPPTHYRSDPYIYLQAARAMTSPYTAHFREPVFPFATKISLAVFGNQDVAVSFASTACSLLAVWFT